MKGIAILGSTGSIGCSTLEVLALHPDRYRVVALGAWRRDELLYEQVLRFAPEFAVMADESAAARLAGRLRGSGSRTQVLAGAQALAGIAALASVEQVMCAIVGAAGLPSTLAAARAGKRILLANKEALVMAGELLLAAVRSGGGDLLPIDSEHNAIFQCLPPGSHCGIAPSGLRRIILTGSGGPFRDWTQAQIDAATPAQAIRHPNWSMGPKISVDSATMMNKGLEFIEARLLFGVAAEQIEVVLHPQSVVHSMVEYLDGSLLAQMGTPDMRTPIAQALAWPERMASGVKSLDLVAAGRLDFLPPDPTRFPCLPLAQQAARTGGLAPAILNAANEVAVQAFLDGQMNFGGIPTVIDKVMQQAAIGRIETLDDVIAADDAARRAARGLLPGNAPRHAGAR
jgi:1-deoxy-D-xylulose-5-phosphate reductoisomerase